jgi:hypothetical protein
VGAELFHKDGHAGRHNETNICLSQLFCKHDYKTGNVSTAKYFWPIHTTTETKVTKVTMATMVTKITTALLVIMVTKAITVP